MKQKDLFRCLLLLLLLFQSHRRQGELRREEPLDPRRRKGEEPVVHCGILRVPSSVPASVEATVRVTFPGHICKYTELQM